MGDRYTLTIKCGGCGQSNEDVYYAPSCGALSFKCEFCGKENWIENYLSGRVISKEELDKLYKAYGFGKG